jgi:hypothetical protein
MRNTRPSAETTPPLQQQSSQGSGNIFMGDIMVQPSKNFEDVSFVEKSAHKHKLMKARLSKDN